LAENDCSWYNRVFANSWYNPPVLVRTGVRIPVGPPPTASCGRRWRVAGVIRSSSEIVEVAARTLKLRCFNCTKARPFATVPRPYTGAPSLLKSASNRKMAEQSSSGHHIENFKTKPTASGHEARAVSHRNLMFLKGTDPRCSTSEQSDVAQWVELQCSCALIHTK
jgi:hypothetical protein